MKCDHIKRIITITSDYIKRLSLYRWMKICYFGENIFLKCLMMILFIKRSNSFILAFFSETHLSHLTRENCIFFLKSFVHIKSYNFWRVIRHFLCSQLLISESLSNWQEKNTFNITLLIFLLNPILIHYDTHLMPFVGFLLKNRRLWLICLQNKIACCHINCNSLLWATMTHLLININRINNK